MSEIEYVYSLSGADFTDFCSVMNDVNDEHRAGEEVEIFKGEEKTPSHSEFVNCHQMIEIAQDNSHENYGEYAEDYLCDISNEQVSELSKLICGWLDKNVKPPNFHAVKNVTKEIVISEGGIL